MKCQEVLVLRSIPSSREKAVREFLDFLEKSIPEDESMHIRLLRNTLVDSDICIQLFREQRGDSPEKSKLGLSLAHSLKEYGLVHHTVWIQEKAWGMEDHKECKRKKD